MPRISFSSWLPFLAWPRPSAALLRGEFWAGMTVGLMLVPQGVAYAALAGMPLVTGIYASLLPALVAVLFSASTRLGVGPTALTSLLIGASLTGLAEPGSAQWVQMAVWIALLCGALQCVMGLARFGWVVNVVTSPVLSGFTQAAALLILSSQLGALTGLRADFSALLQTPSLGLFDLTAAAFGLGAVVALWLAKRLKPTFPAAIVVLVRDARVQGVLFTGSTETARVLQAALAERLNAHGQPVPLIAETGGQNCMVVDSSALLEQVVTDAVASAFEAAGQRCSALRVLCVQGDVADRLVEMLQGAMAEIRMGAPAHLAVDMGPVIDERARMGIEAHVSAMQQSGCRVYRISRNAPDETNAWPIAKAHPVGTYVQPTLIEIDRIAQLEREVFGPVLHIVRYARSELPELLQAIHDTGYMLKATLGGLGGLNAQQFQADSVRLELSGLGNATVTARENATLNLSGLGSVTVFGKPANRNVSVDGLGKVSWK
eukprot:gene24702-31077_t